jgi:endonuclease YncB( thermonuclease family)
MASAIVLAAATLLSCTVHGVFDGDTLKARCGRSTIKVRIAEIDAPESKQAFGTQSKWALSRLCLGQHVLIEKRGLDRYGRTSGRAICSGKDAGAEQVKSGMAWVYDGYATDKNLYRLQDEARANKRGLWSRSRPQPPWEWRKRERKRRSYLRYFFQ